MSYFSVFLIILACFFWGLVYTVPLYISGFNSIEIALGRYFCYGLVSFILMILFCHKSPWSIPLKIWWRACYFTLLANFCFYTSLIMGMRLSSPSVITLILGLGPITIAFFGSWLLGENQIKKLITPSLLILMGLTLVNFESIMLDPISGTADKYIFGLFCGFISLSAWTWFVLANLQFLEQHPEITASDWTLIIGTATFFLSILGFFLLFIFYDSHMIDKFFIINENFISYILGISILGVFSSGFGLYLWNYATLSVPISLSGQLTIFETIFGLIFIYIARQSLPTNLESVGIFCMLLGIIGGVYLLQKNPTIRRIHE
jgi:drug/metabolite transporter (DMT)-like permease